MRRSTYDRVKRVGDIVLSTTGLVVSAPVQLVVAGLVRAKLGSPVLFRQERPGKDAQIFTLVKFRTMLDPDPERGLVSDADRLTGLGKVLRSTSLDELPTLWNVLRGDMSLVGPRPLLPRYMPYFTNTELCRFEVRPGITGWAQVSGRNHAPWDERLAYDVAYVHGLRFSLDLWILMRTVASVVRRRGVEVAPAETMNDLDEERRLNAR
jgi:lipopolysaccharide/colanic/teichoic acid biosynthesis glycosyltransferase